MALELTDDNFDAEVIESDQPVLVDFYSTHCIPCKMLAVTIDELSAELEGRVKVCKLNTEDALETALRFQIQSVPVVILFKDGQPAAFLPGVKPKKQYLEEIERVAV